MTSDDDTQLVLTVERTAALLGISRTLAYELIGRGDLPAVRLGRRIVVPRAAIDRLVADATSARSAHLADRSASSSSGRLPLTVSQRRSRSTSA
jgi:excisionase family DNA binding protein